MLPFWSLNSKRTDNIFTREDLSGLWWRLLRKILIGSCDEDSEDVIRVDSCAFHPCTLPQILFGQAEQCLLGVQVPELWKSHFGDKAN